MSVTVVVVVLSPMVMVIVADLLSFCEFVAVRVIVCSPFERSFLDTVRSVPISPSMSEDQTREFPDRVPSLKSLAIPEKIINSPVSKWSPSDVLVKNSFVLRTSRQRRNPS